MYQNETETPPMNNLYFLTNQQKIDLIQNVTQENEELREQIKKDKENLRQRILELSVLYDTSNSLSYSLNYEEIIKIIMDALYKVLRYESCSILLVGFTHNCEMISRVSTPIADSILQGIENNVISALTPFIGQVLKREGIIFNTLRAYDQDANLPISNELVKTFFNVPLIFKNEVLGIINVCSTKKHAFSQDEVTFLYTMGNQLSSTLGRLQIIIASEKSKISTMIESMSDGIIMTDENNNLSVINPAARDLLGIPASEDIGSDIVHARFQEINLYKPFAKVYGNQVAILNQEVSMGKQTLIASIAPVTDINSKLVGVVTVLRDITEIKNIDRIKTQRLNAINEIKEVLNSIYDLDNLLAVLIDIILKIANSDMCSIMLMEDRRLLTKSHRKFPDKVRKTYRYLTGESVSELTSKTLKTIFITNYDEDNRMDHTVVKIPIRWYIGIPLMIKNQLIGIVNVASKSDDDNQQDLTQDELDTLETIIGLSAAAIENALLYRQNLKQEHINQELRIATEIQHKLLPANLPQIKGYYFGAISVSAHEVGGDYYDVFNLGEGKYGLLIADIVGKGVPAALLMVMIKSILMTYVHTIESPAKLFTKVNEVLCKDFSIDKFIPMCYGVLNTNTGELVYTNAGHEPGQVFRARDKTFFSLDSDGFPIGALEDTIYEESSLQLQEGDILFYFTDGVVEARNRKGEEFTNIRLRKVIEDNQQQGAKKIVDEIYLKVLDFSESTPQHDDLTLLIIKHAEHLTMLETYIAIKELRVSSNKEQVHRVRELVSTVSRQMGFDSSSIHDIKLAVNEAHANIIEHAYEGRPNGEIIFRFYIYHDRLEILIKDFGKTASYKTIRTDTDMDGLEGSGLGVYLIRKLVDKVEYKITPKIGTEVMLTKYLNKEPTVINS